MIKVYCDRFAFYGSLRRGMENYRRYQDNLRYLGTQRIQGFSLFALKDYPYAIRVSDPESEIVIEVFQIPDAGIREEIHQLELEAGYTLEIIQLLGINTGIYLYEKCVNNLRVEGGDWVKFFGKESQ